MTKNVCILVSGLLAYAPVSYVQSAEELEGILVLSGEIKKYEKANWGVDPGNFATRMPKTTPVLQYRLFAQSKFKLAYDYLYVDRLVDFYEEPDLSRVVDIEGKDLSIRLTSMAGTYEITAALAASSRAGRIVTILHEDFHAYISAPLEPRSVEESFASAFGYFAGMEIARKLFNDDKLNAEIRNLAKKRAESYRRFNSCFKKLEELYRSPLSLEKKLEEREKLFDKCRGKNSTETVNNAVLVDVITYSRHYFYAMKKLKKFGVRRFSEAYIVTCLEKFGPEAIEAYEKTWLKKFEENLLKTEPD